MAMKRFLHFLSRFFSFSFLNEFVKKKDFWASFDTRSKNKRIFGAKNLLEIQICLEGKKGFWNHFSKIINSDNTQFLGAGLTMKNGEPSPQGLEACPILKVRLLWLI